MKKILFFLIFSFLVSCSSSRKNSTEVTSSSLDGLKSQNQRLKMENILLKKENEVLKKRFEKLARQGKAKYQREVRLQALEKEVGILYDEKKEKLPTPLNENEETLKHQDEKKRTIQKRKPIEKGQNLYKSLQLKRQQLIEKKLWRIEDERTFKDISKTLQNNASLQNKKILDRAKNFFKILSRRLKAEKGYAAK